MDPSVKLPRKKRYGLFSGSAPLTRGQNRILDIFFYTVLAGTFISMLGIILYYVYAYAALHSGDHGFDWLLGIFSDFVYIMNVSLEDSPYLIEDSSYPPIAIAILYPFALICKGVFAKYSNYVLSVDELTSRVVLHPQFWIAMVLFFVVCSAVIILAIIKKYKLPPLAALKVAILILTSAPFIYAVMRGNTIYFALIFLLLFLLLYKSESAALREFGYVCLVIAGLIKIYPLFFGVFLLCDKKIWASVRVAIYTVVLFVLSFLLFKGGFDHFAPFIENLGGFASNDLRLAATNNLSITSLLYRAVSVFSPTAADSAVFDNISMIVLIAVFLVATAAAVYTRSDLSRYFIASSIVILIPSVSYFYVLVFMLLPFMEFLKEYDSIERRKRLLYTVLFFIIFFAPLILAKNFILQALCVVIMLALETATVFGNERRSRRPISVKE